MLQQHSHFLIKNQASYLSDEDINNLKEISKMHQEMVHDILGLRQIEFSKAKIPRYDYADQTKISLERVDLATACAIYYGLNTGMIIQYLKSEYVGESRDTNEILKKVSPYISEVNCEHIKQVINQGCQSNINFKEDYDNKLMVLQKGNQQTFLQFPEVTAKAMNKEEKNSHVLAFKQWLVHFSPYCRATPQGIREKYRKHRVIFTLRHKHVPMRLSSITRLQQTMRLLLILVGQRPTSSSTFTIGELVILTK
jgi:hypothetical protein